MINTLDKIKVSFDKLSPNETEELKKIKAEVKYFINKKKFDDAIELLKQILKEHEETSGASFIHHIKQEIVRTYNQHINYILNLPGKDSKNVQKTKYLFTQCDQFIDNNIDSYLLKNNNYACYLSQTSHNKQAYKLFTKIQKIDILNYISNEMDKDYQGDNSLSTISKDYSNLCSLDNNMKNNYKALISAMQSLAINQFEKLFCDKTDEDYDNINKNMCYSYYNLGVQQEFLKRNKDCKASFAGSKIFKPDEKCGKKEPTNEFGFLSKIHLKNDDYDIINFGENLIDPGALAKNSLGK